MGVISDCDRYRLRMGMIIMIMIQTDIPTSISWQSGQISSVSGVAVGPVTRHCYTLCSTTGRRGRHTLTHTASRTSLPAHLHIVYDYIII